MMPFVCELYGTPGLSSGLSSVARGSWVVVAFDGQGSCLSRSLYCVHRGTTLSSPSRIFVASTCVPYFALVVVLLFRAESWDHRRPR